MKTKFFVYGTLKVGGRNAYEFDKNRVSVTKAVASGTMYSVLGSFPAVIFGTKNKIFGEIHEYKNEKEVQRIFDLIEGFCGKDHPENLYNKIKINVVDDNKNNIDCYAYEFNKPMLKEYKKVKTGIWEI